MICEKTAKRFCCEDISKIENYDKAIADKTQTWHCHHRLETSKQIKYSALDLIIMNLYYYRPSKELIFLSPKQHCEVHKNRLGTYHTEESKKKMSNSHKGKKFSEEHKRKISESHRSRKEPAHKQTQEARMKIREVQLGMRCWNNGIINKRAKECPGKDFVRGRLRYKNTKPVDAAEE